MFPFRDCCFTHARTQVNYSKADGPAASANHTCKLMRLHKDIHADMPTRHGFPTNKFVAQLVHARALMDTVQHQVNSSQGAGVAGTALTHYLEIGRAPGAPMRVRVMAYAEFARCVISGGKVGDSSVHALLCEVYNKCDGNFAWVSSTPLDAAWCWLCAALCFAHAAGNAPKPDKALGDIVRACKVLFWALPVFTQAEPKLRMVMDVSQLILALVREHHGLSNDTSLLDEAIPALDGAVALAHHPAHLGALHMCLAELQLLTLFRARMAASDNFYDQQQAMIQELAHSHYRCAETYLEGCAKLTASDKPRFSGGGGKGKKCSEALEELTEPVRRLKARLFNALGRFYASKPMNMAPDFARSRATHLLMAVDGPMRADLAEVKASVFYNMGLAFAGNAGNSGANVDHTMDDWGSDFNSLDATADLLVQAEAIPFSANIPDEDPRRWVLKVVQTKFDDHFGGAMERMVDDFYASMDESQKRGLASASQGLER